MQMIQLSYTVNIEKKKSNQLSWNILTKVAKNELIIINIQKTIYDF